MPKQHNVKCFYCGITFDTNSTDFVKVNATRYAHIDCHEKNLKAKTQEQKNKEELYAYINKLFNIDQPTKRILRQINDYITNNKYTYSGILKTLKYFYEIKHGDINKANGGIGIVEYVYKDAYLYWKSVQEAQQKNRKEFIVDVPTKEIHITSPKRECMGQRKRKFSFLDEEMDTYEF